MQAQAHFKRWRWEDAEAGGHRNAGLRVTSISEENLKASQD